MKGFQVRITQIRSYSQVINNTQLEDYPDNVLLLFLPPYCPELNPVERLWQDIKQAIRFGAFEDLCALKEEVAQIVRRYSEAEVASLTGYGYVIDAINAL